MTRGGVVLVFLLLAVLHVHVVSSHICIISPLQRLDMDVSNPGDDACYRMQGPCGANTPGAVKTTLVGGSTYTVKFQQNLNHFTVADPGYMDASIALVANPTEADFKPFGNKITDYNAYNMITQTNFSITGTVPNVAAARAVIRVRYVSNNPKELTPNGTTFYNCADVTITPAADSGAAVDPVAPAWTKPARRLAADPCCTVKQWKVDTFQTGSWRDPTGGFIAYDAVSQLMRIDYSTGAGQGTTIYDGTWQMYLNFTSGIQWFLNVHNGVCLGYGLDMWQDWCYGPSQMQEYGGTDSIGDTPMDVWRNGEFSWGTSRTTCVPMLMYRYFGDLTVYTAFTPTLPPNVFVPPASCHLRALSNSPAPISTRDLLRQAGHPGY